MPQQLVFCLAVLVFLSHLVLSAEIYVSPFGSDTAGDGTKSNPFATLQRAIDDNPEVVVMMPGVHKLDIVISKNIKIVGGGSSPRATILTGSVSPKLMVSKDASVSVENLTFNTVTPYSYQGSLTLSKVFVTGGGCGVIAYSETHIVDSVLYNNNHNLCADSPSPAVTIINTSIQGATKHGIYATTGKLTIINSTIHDNGAAGIFLDGRLLTVNVRNSSFVNNGASGISVSTSSLNVEGAVIEGNKGVNGSGILADHGASVYLDSVSLNGNHADNVGGGFYCGEHVTIFFGNGEIKGNSANAAGSGECDQTCDFSLESSTVKDNESRKGVESHCKDLKTAPKQ